MSFVFRAVRSSSSLVLLITGAASLRTYFLVAHPALNTMAAPATRTSNDFILKLLNPGSSVRSGGQVAPACAGNASRPWEEQCRCQSLQTASLNQLNGFKHLQEPIQPICQATLAREARKFACNRIFTRLRQ